MSCPNDTDRIKEAYERACLQGLFTEDTYTQFGPGDEPYQLHSVVFTACDGYHLGWYFDTKAEADKAVTEINSLHSIEAVDAYFEKLREDYRKSVRK